MKIGFDAKRLFLNDTGLGNYSRTLVKNLHQFYPGNEYFLFTPSIRKTKDTAFFIDHPDFKIITPQNRFKIWWRTKGMVQDIIKENLDIFHGLSHELPIGLAGKGIKTIVTVHDLIFERYSQLFPLWDRWMYQLKYRNAAKVADKIIAISENTKNDIMEIWHVPEQKISVVYQSCSEGYFDAPFRHLPRKYFLYVGAVIERKNLLDIIDAYQSKPFLHQYPLMVIGNGKKYLQRVKDRVKQYKIEDKVIFKGSLSNKALLEYYDQSMALIYPSSYEGFGIPVIEAALRKVPVICSNVSSMPEAGGPDALYVSPGNVKQLAVTMETIVKSSENIKNSIENTYIYASKRFSAESTARSLFNEYLKLTSIMSAT